MPKYKLLKDCPHGRAGSVWIKEDGGTCFERMVDENGYAWQFPQSTFSSWFEEIPKMKLFTRGQRSEIRSHISNLETDFADWLNEHTEK